MGLSVGLRGNGMAFTSALIRRVPHRAFSVVEDVEYGAMLGLAGVRVVYVPEAVVLGEMPVTADAAASQRERWESGRWVLVRRFVPELLRAALARRDRVPLDLAMDILVPPLTFLVTITAAGFSCATILLWLGDAGPFGIIGWGVSLAGVLLYVVRGWMLADASSKDHVGLWRVPVYAAWKIRLYLRRAGAPREWIRTKRVGER